MDNQNREMITPSGPRVTEAGHIDARLPLLLTVRVYPKRSGDGGFVGHASYSFNNYWLIKRVNVYADDAGELLISQPGFRTKERERVSYTHGLRGAFTDELNACIKREFELAIEELAGGRTPRREGRYWIGGDEETVRGILALLGISPDSEEPEPPSLPERAAPAGPVGNPFLSDPAPLDQAGTAQ